MKHVAYLFIGTLFILIPVAAVVIYGISLFSRPLVNPLGSKPPKERPLLSYTFENLRHTQFTTSAIKIGTVIDETPDSTAHLFYFSVPKKPYSLPTETVSGLINIPKKEGNYPLIVMLRGYAPLETFQSGTGTQPSAQVFVKNGFITLAPDFLGYGESSSPSADVYESRFQTYTTALTLLASLPSLNTALDTKHKGLITADVSRVGLWGHSNGGHIALSVLSISGASYPTVLWAPVSKPFPYSILYYTDESDDQGKYMRKSLAAFEEDYDILMFSPSTYYRYIRSPISIFQGESDQEVPVWWSNELVDQLKSQGVDVSYTVFPGGDHNLRPSGWSTAVSGSMEFFRANF